MVGVPGTGVSMAADGHHLLYSYSVFCLCVSALFVLTIIRLRKRRPSKVKLCFWLVAGEGLFNPFGIPAWHRLIGIPKLYSLISKPPQFNTKMISIAGDC